MSSILPRYDNSGVMAGKQSGEQLSGDSTILPIIDTRKETKENAEHQQSVS